MPEAMQIRPAEPAPRGVLWIPVALAAQRLQQSTRNVTKRCGEEWFPLGKAGLRKPQAGGKPCWHVREDADPLLSSILWPEHIAFDLRTLKAEQRAILLRRKEILDGWIRTRESFIAEGKTERFATAGYLRRLELEGAREKVSRGTLFRWDSLFNADGIKGLADARWSTSATDKATVGGAMPGPHAGDFDSYFNALKSYWLRLSRPSKKSAWEAANQMAFEKGWPTKEYRTARHYLQQIPRAVQIKFRDGRKAFEAKAAPSIERDYSTLHSNEMWVGDHHQFDVMVKHDGKHVRPWLTAWEDMRSRKIVGWCILAHDPNQNAVLSALKHGCLSHGVPEGIYIDNGKDYDAYSLHGRTKQERRSVRVEVDGGRVRGILNHLGCKVIHAWPYHGQSKPIERFFGTVELQFGKTWPTYCGRNPENKPEDLPKKLARGAAPTLDEFTEKFSEWLTKGYHASGHTGDAMNGHTPEEVYAASWNGAAKRTTSAEALELLLLRETQPVKVTKNGVAWGRLRYGQSAPELFKLQGKEVYLRVDPRDVTRVLVYSMDDQFICIAVSNRRVPANATHKELSDAIKEGKQIQKIATQYHGIRPRLHQDTTELMIDGRARQNAKDEKNREPLPPDGPASLKAIKSPVTSAATLKALGIALEDRKGLKIAVGAESYSKPFRELYKAFEPQPEPEEFQASSFTKLMEHFGRKSEESP